jgi:hypothetical protein
MLANSARLTLTTWGQDMTEAVFPTIPLPDARCFRRGTGNGWPGGQPVDDMAPNILKEFRPDPERRFPRNRKSTGNGSL